MALDKIEKEFSLLTVLRDSVNFYLSYLQERKEEREISITELAEVPAQVEQMSLKKEQAEKKIGELREEQSRIDRESASIAPCVQLLAKIGVTKTEIAERQKKLREKEDALAVQETAAKSKPDDEIAQSNLLRDKALFRGMKTSDDLIIQRLGDDLIWYAQQLGESGVNAKDVEQHARTIQGRLQKVTETIDEKAQGITNMDRFVQANQEKVTRLEELKEDLSRYETDLANATQVAGIISEVPFNVQLVPAEHTG